MEPPTPQCVGREFVRQYYTLNQAPLHLHRFTMRSPVSYTAELTVRQRQRLYAANRRSMQKIVQLNFKDCHAKIRKKG